jgi:hypothetical protein
LTPHVRSMTLTDSSTSCSRRLGRHGGTGEPWVRLRAAGASSGAEEIKVEATMFDGAAEPVADDVPLFCRIESLERGPRLYLLSSSRSPGTTASSTSSAPHSPRTSPSATCLPSGLSAAVVVVVGGAISSMDYCTVQWAVCPAV